MTERVIQLVPESTSDIPLDFAAPTHDTLPLDKRNRRLHDLRISVTDRCNFRCVYCMPKSIFDKDYAFLPHQSLLTFEEIRDVARHFVNLGVEKIRLTGGEPLLRKNLEILVHELATLRSPSGKPVELTLTTNGTLLPKKAKALKEAGLHRITVSLDALSNETFKAMNDVDFSVEQALEGIQAAHEVGLGPIKVNMVVKKGVNDHEIVPMARYFKQTPHILRFIEYMDVGSSNDWKLDEVVPSREILNLISSEIGPLRALDANYTGEVAERLAYADGQGEIGLISSVTQAFCKDCSRIRLSTEGKLYTCLFASQGHDLKALIRNPNLSAEERAIKMNHAIRNLWTARRDNYSEIRFNNTVPKLPKIEMSYIGG